MDCSCDPPGVGPGDEDGGPTGDAGVGDNDAGGQVLLPSDMWALLDDGTLARVNVGSSEVSYPFGRRYVDGTLVKTAEDTLVFFEGDGSASAGHGDLIELDPATGERVIGTRVRAPPLQLAVSGTDVAIGLGNDSPGYVGTWTEGQMPTEMSFLCAGMAYDDDGLVVSTYDGLRRIEADAVYASTRRCSTMTYIASEDAFLCGDVSGAGGFLLDATDGSETPVVDISGPDIVNAATTSDGYVVMRNDCTMDPATFDDLEPLCPFGMVELGDELYFTSQYGGLFARDANDTVRVVGTFVRQPSGLDDNGTTVAVGVSLQTRVLAANTDLEDPWVSPEGEDPVGIGVASDDSLWLVGEDYTLRMNPGDTDWTEVDSYSPEAVYASRGGSTMYVARAAEGLFAFDMTGGTDATLTEVSTDRADLVAGCDDSRALTVDTEAGVLRVIDDGASSVRVSDLSSFGVLTSLGCTNGWLVIGNADGALWASRIDSDDELTGAGTLATAALHLTPATGG